MEAHSMNSRLYSIPLELSNRPKNHRSREREEGDVECPDDREKQRSERGQHGCPLKVRMLGLPVVEPYADKYCD